MGSELVITSQEKRCKIHHRHFNEDICSIHMRGQKKWTGCYDVLRREYRIWKILIYCHLYCHHCKLMTYTPLEYITSVKRTLKNSPKDMKDKHSPVSQEKRVSKIVEKECLLVKRLFHHHPCQHGSSEDVQNTQQQKQDTRPGRPWPLFTEHCPCR